MNLTKILKRTLSIVLIVALILPLSLLNSQTIDAAVNKQVMQLYEQDIARGINYSKNRYIDYQGISGRNNEEHIIRADLNDPSVELITAKANDKVLQLRNLSEQISNEQSKGRNIIAGINADMFNIALGTMHFGTPLGLQVKDGNILVGFETIWSGPRYPIFAIDKNRQAIISYVDMDNYLLKVDEAYEQANNGKPNPDLRIPIDTINRNNTDVMNDRMILATPQLANNPSIGFTEAQAENATLTVLKNISDSNDGKVKLGHIYTAEVVSIGDSKSTGVNKVAIPADGMVLASQGVKANWIRNNLKAGDKVRFSFNIKDHSGKFLDLEQAVSAWLPLVQNGQALTKEAMLKLCENDWDKGTAVISANDKARTAIGYTSDNKLIALVFDGGGAGKNSYGINLPDLAMRMQELGVVAAVNFDGGGSSQMNARMFGENAVQIINLPSDNFERPVSNSILLASNAPRTYDVAKLLVKQDINVFKNTTYTFQLRGQDSNYNPVDLNDYDINWAIEPIEGSSGLISGTIDAKGKFTAGDFPAQQKVTASIASVNATAKLNVFDRVSSMKFSDAGIIAIELGVPKQIHILAYAEDGSPILIDNDKAQWTVTPTNIASISKDGLLNVWAKGEGKVTAKIGGQEATISFISGLDSQLIDSYETNLFSDYNVSGFIGGNSTITSEVAKEGQKSLRVDYDYNNWGRVYNGTINVLLNKDKRCEKYTTNIRPKELGMWVYGDGQAPWLRAIIKDGNANSHIINLSSNINWSGWKYVSSTIPDNIPLPISLDYFYMVETDRAKNLKGTVYFDDIRFIY